MAQNESRCLIIRADGNQCEGCAGHEGPHTAPQALKERREAQRRDSGKRRPGACECDNTHEQNGTCCRPCWGAGFRTVATVSP